MRTRLPRPLRLGLPAAVVIALALSGCSDPAPVEPAPAAPPTSPATTAPSSGPTGGAGVDASTTGSDGLTVRYLDGKTVKTVRVEDFPR